MHGIASDYGSQATSTPIRIAGAFLFVLLQCLIMWKVKFDDDHWIAKGKYGPEITSEESEAWIFPDIPALEKQQKAAQRLQPNSQLIVISAFDERE